MHHIIAFSIRNKLIVSLLILALIGVGFYQALRLPIDAIPDITDNQVQVITISPSLGAPDVERFITFPIEQALSNIPSLKHQRSFSRFGLSVITVVFEDHVDVYWARRQVSERLTNVADMIPAGMGRPEMAPVTTGLGEIYQYVLRPLPGYESRYSALELRSIQDWIVRRQLLGVKGVADVASFGGFLKQYEIAVNPGRLAAYKLTLHDLIKALEADNQNAGGAYIEKGPEVLFIRTEGLIQNFEDLGQIVVRQSEGGAPLLLRDVAEARFGHAVRYGAMTYNGQSEAAGAVVMMLKGENSGAVIARVKEQVARIQTMLPEGVVIEPFLDRTKMVNNAIRTVAINLSEGALIVTLVLFLFLSNLRAALLVASVIPLAMLFAVTLMNLFGVSGNLMSLGTLDFGLIVDGAVIVVEAVLHQLALIGAPVAAAVTLSRAQMDQEVKDTASRLLNSAVFGQVIILIVYIPILSLQGVEGKMFKPMAMTVIFALLGAFLLSLTYVPMMSAWALSRRLDHKVTFSDRIMHRLEQAYRRSLAYALRRGRWALGITALILIAGWLMAIRLGGEFIPELPEGDFAVDTRVLPGSNLQTSVQAMLRSERLLLERFPEIEKIVGKTGSSEIPTDPMPIEASDMMVILKPRHTWTSARTYKELAEKMTEALSEIPGVTYSFQYPVAMRFNELMTGARQDVACKIFGENLDTLAHYARILGRLCATVAGAQDVYVEPVSGVSQIVVRYDRAQLARYGARIADANLAVNAAFAGTAAGQIYEGERRYDIVVRLDSAYRRAPDDLAGLLVPITGGGQVPLGHLAHVSVESGVNQIQRENAQRRITVGFNVRGRDVQSAVEDLQKQVEAQLRLPPGYHIAYGGVFENLREATDRLRIAVPVALALIFVLLYFAFYSLRYGLLIFSSIPPAAVGGICALTLRDMPFSISAGVGFIALFGVAVLNGIVLLAEFKRQQQSGIANLSRVVLRGGATRLRPVLMTASVASLGFLPMALSLGEGAEVQRPLATVVIGGLALATLLTLYTLPVLFVMTERLAAQRASRAPLSALLLLPVLFALVPTLNAQTPVTLQEALDNAAARNPLVVRGQLAALAQQQRIGAAREWPRLEVAVEYGQINSAYRDHRIGVAQEIPWPGVLGAQEALARAEWELQLSENALDLVWLKRETAAQYIELLALNDKISMLRRADSLWEAYEQMVALRLQAGETNALESAQAALQRSLNVSQRYETQQALTAAQKRLCTLMGAEADCALVPQPIPLPAPYALSLAPAPHPTMQRAAQQMRASEARLNVVNSRRKPNLFAGLNSQTLYGIGSDDIFYNYGARFQSLQVGFRVPLSFGALRWAAESARTEIRLAQLRLDQETTLLQRRYDVAVAQYSAAWEAVDFFEKNMTPALQTLRASAGRQLQTGEINAAEWNLLALQWLGYETRRLELYQTLRQRYVEMLFFSNFSTQQ